MAAAEHRQAAAALGFAKSLSVSPGLFYRLHYGLKPSFRLTARLKTRRPGLLSLLSAQK